MFEVTRRLGYKGESGASLNLVMEQIETEEITASIESLIRDLLEGLNNDEIVGDTVFERLTGFALSILNRF